MPTVQLKETSKDNSGVHSDDIDSMSSDYAESEADNFIKAFQFFSKENTTKINIAQQKMQAWVKKMKEGIKLSPRKSPTTMQRLKSTSSKQDGEP